MGIGISKLDGKPDVEARVWERLPNKKYPKSYFTFLFITYGGRRIMHFWVRTDQIEESQSGIRNIDKAITNEFKDPIAFNLCWSDGGKENDVRFLLPWIKNQKSELGLPFQSLDNIIKRKIEKAVREEPDPRICSKIEEFGETIVRTEKRVRARTYISHLLEYMQPSEIMEMVQITVVEEVMKK